MEIALQGVPQADPPHEGHPLHGAFLGPRPLPRSQANDGRTLSLLARILDLEAFSHNPTHLELSRPLGFSTKRDDQLREKLNPAHDRLNPAARSLLEGEQSNTWTKGSIGHAFTLHIQYRKSKSNELYPFVPHEISVLASSS
ncbi:unnamed protein product [Sphenostylis stenocarpa]|uniref:Uncharacterized protein n=1 Tax=Sphenostylis stenocarpa TaxID=92480 RepID=A0AA86SMH9_9FABA|nr:unnamed protein product [Sphenostylis stenocarpa]